MTSLMNDTLGVGKFVSVASKLKKEDSGIRISNLFGIQMVESFRFPIAVYFEGIKNLHSSFIVKAIQVT